MPNGSSHPAAAQNAEGPQGSGQTVKASGPDPLLGRAINDRFKVTGLIARGGMGKVYKAEQAPLGRICAIKVLNPNYSGEHDPEFHKRFFLEASISSKLTHPNTVTIFDYGRTDDNIYYMAMEFLEGRTLHRGLREEGPFVEERATHIARQICRSLREAHSLGVIHRDLKPANVYLIEHGDEKDFVKVLDFGLVKNIDESKGEDLTQTGLFMGSPKYMAPEQIRGEHVDARTDIYALGVILYEMVTGKVPFDRPNSVNILMAHVNEPVPRLREMNPSIQVSEALEGTIYKCVEKNPDDRYKSMDEVLGALKRAGGGTMTGTISGADRSGSFDLLATTGSFTPQPTPGSINSLSPDSGSGAILASGAPPADTRKASKTPLVIGGVVALLALIGIIAMVSGKKDDTTTNPQPSTTAPALSVPTPTTTQTATNTAAAKPTPSAPVDEAVKLKIESDPTGAQVREDGTIICDKTPCDVLVSDKPRKLSLELKDHKTETISVKKGDPPRAIKLQKSAVWSPPAGGGKKDDKPSGGGNKDFKDSPY
jgi:eukaryotic-like serine/threonine-protein kinase